MLTGAISALENARQDDMIGHFGMCVEGAASTVLGMWQFHDAFDFLVCRPEALKTLEPVARARRVGVVVESKSPVGQVQLMPLRMPECADE